jgi:hypothetical protein
MGKKNKSIVQKSRAGDDEESGGLWTMPLSKLNSYDQV